MSHKRTLPVWWSIYWRTTIVGVVVSGIAGGIVGFFLAMSGLFEQIKLFSSIAGYLAGVPVSLWAVKCAMDNHHLSAAPPLKESIAPQT